MKKNTIKFLMIIAIILLVANVLLNYWFFFDYHLKFDSQIFNNILTPILTLFSVIIYAFTLNVALKQNKVILSQNIKPYFEKRIINMQKMAKKISFFEKDSKGDLLPINGINYIDYINKAFKELINDEDYNKDVEDYRKGVKLSKNWILNRSYTDKYFFFYSLTHYISPVNFFYDDVVKLINDIQDSKLILDDKLLLKKQIRDYILSQYLSFVELDKKHKFFPVVPYIPLGEKYLKFVKLSETRFSEKYDVFIKLLE